MSEKVPRDLWENSASPGHSILLCQAGDWGGREGRGKCPGWGQEEDTCELVQLADIGKDAADNESIRVWWLATGWHVLGQTTDLRVKQSLATSLKEAQQESHKISSHEIYLENCPITDTLKILIWVGKNLWEMKIVQILVQPESNGSAAPGIITC